jgi:hypothetical protein
MSADVPPTAMDEASEASSEEEPLKKTHLRIRQVKANQPQKNQRRAPVHVTQRATEQWSSLAGSGPWGPVSGPLFEKGLPGSENLLNLMVL